MMRPGRGASVCALGVVVSAELTLELALELEELL